MALARALGLSFAAVELVLERDEPTCLDVTGLPQVHRWSRDLEDAVVSALCLLLANGDGP